MFRTRTGQTGLDAYEYEATQIANAQRELDERMRRLCRAMHEEAPKLFERRTDWHPNLGVRGTDAKLLATRLRELAR